MQRELAVDEIRMDGEIQPRVKLDQFLIDEYAEAMKAGAEFPVVVVFFDNEIYWLADGFHRTHAAKKAGLKAISVDIQEGTRRDAILFAVGANAEHGARRTNEDKRRAVEKLLVDEEWSGWNDSEVARRCKVDNSFVSKLRTELSLDNQKIKKPVKRKVKRGDSVYEMDTSNIGKAKGIEPEVREAVRSTSIAESRNLQAQLANLEPEKQRAVAAKLSSGEATSLQAAKKIVAEEEKSSAPGVSLPSHFHLIHGDMFKVDLPTDVDLVLVDFPYNISDEGKYSKQDGGPVSFDAGEWDKEFDTEIAIAVLAYALKPGGAFVFFTDKAKISYFWEYCMWLGLQPKNVIVWHKTNPPPAGRPNFQSSVEFILWTVKQGADYTWNGGADTHNYFECSVCSGNERVENPRHPTQKPVALMKWLLELFSNDGDKVLDSCAGVGSTGATGLSREYWLIEKEEKYFKQMEIRLSVAV